MHIELVLQLVVYLWIIGAVGGIILGIFGVEKRTHYGFWDILFGIITLIVIALWIW